MTHLYDLAHRSFPQPTLSTRIPAQTRIRKLPDNLVQSRRIIGLGGAPRSEIISEGLVELV